MKRSSIRSLLHLAVIVAVLSEFPVLADGAKPRRRKKSGKKEAADGSNSMTRVGTTLKITYALLFLPILITFFYSLYRDPATPQIMKALWNIAKKKSMGYLGRPEEVDLENKRA
eukprot:CAMPEP_0118640118 /NCGR_PEP_ID=MMETSP0785-20121206/4584_1 /TAXON_ID=91992 /ORGANISM="Bolidomonas pacifica, Strain CCMP 1866" /LENGTH=113 /DNA_ID=CAMNT_0006531487 /DNA_START=85 /DNA_END=426 /DNA_ORIENTATION=+